MYRWKKCHQYKLVDRTLICNYLDYQLINFSLFCVLYYKMWCFSKCRRLLLRVLNYSKLKMSLWALENCDGYFFPFSDFFIDQKINQLIMKSSANESIMKIVAGPERRKTYFTFIIIVSVLQEFPGQLPFVDYTSCIATEHFWSLANVTNTTTIQRKARQDILHS